MDRPLIAAVLGYVAACLIGLATLLVVTGPSHPADDMVDVALVLAIDVSASVDDTEREIQRAGYAKAITHPEVMQAIAEGAHGRILVTVIEWSDARAQDVRVPWTVIASPSDAASVAAQIKAHGSTITHSTTSVSGAMIASLRALEAAPLRAEREVVDVSGDGKDYETNQVKVARAALVARGVTINGLPILASPDGADIVEWYRDEVIGGPGAFLSPAKGFHEIAPAVRRKLVLEIG